jgi:hypothetical protein
VTSRRVRLGADDVPVGTGEMPRRAAAGERFEVEFVDGEGFRRVEG